ncbi:MAG TPA: hypothetical protein VJ461_05555 [Candidatus Nanoarchaeia archaeon]|nr:hypothetical protein [Candidatus Nanoarchaeia archaeon]
MIGRIIKEGLLEAKLEREARKRMKRTIKQNVNELVQLLESKESIPYWLHPNKISISNYLGSLVTVHPMAYHHYINENESYPNIDIANFFLEKCRDPRYFTDSYVIRCARTGNYTIGAKPLAVAKTEDEIKKKLYSVLRKTVRYAARKTKLHPQNPQSIRETIASIKPHDPYESK